MQEEKSCFNCKFFIRHYGMDSTSFYKLNCGHCLNTEADKLKRDKRRGFGYPCALWEKGEEEKEVINLDSILIKLHYIAEHIEDISLLLKDKKRRVTLPETLRTDKPCFTCNEFTRYYVKGRTGLRETSVGYCKSLHLSRKKKEACPNIDSCKFRVDKRETIDSEAILTELFKAEKTLKNIALFLKSTNR